ncbi:unnamed protein product, partial [Didymodactylos carnosus]
SFSVPEALHSRNKDRSRSPHRSHLVGTRQSTLNSPHTSSSNTIHPRFQLESSSTLTLQPTAGDLNRSRSLTSPQHERPATIADVTNFQQEDIGRYHEASRRIPPTSVQGAAIFRHADEILSVE